MEYTIDQILTNEEFEKVKYVINYEYNSGNILKIPSEFAPDEGICKVLMKTHGLNDKTGIKKCFITEFVDGKEGKTLVNYL